MVPLGIMAAIVLSPVHRLNGLLVAFLLAVSIPAAAMPERSSASGKEVPAQSAEQVAAEAAGSSPAIVEDEAFDEFDEFEDDAKTVTAFDPLSGYNRVMFNVNDKLYYWLLKPAAKGYGFIIPQFARTAIGKAFHNLAFPLRFVNQILQLKFKLAGKELGRFTLNSTVGVAGLWDPAGRWLKWHSQDEDFGQTLGRYGVGDGFPIVLPIFGQSNVRDALGRLPNFLVHPVWYVGDAQTNLSIAAGEQFNFASLHLGEYETIKKDALDPYTFIRDAYKQNRDKKIRE
jgi:phospholipid-binding lipoprotein MlaA